jgi:hypothetical protein
LDDITEEFGATREPGRVGFVVGFEADPEDFLPGRLRDRVSDRLKGIFEKRGRSTGADAHIWIRFSERLSGAASKTHDS